MLHAEKFITSQKLEIDTNSIWLPWDPRCRLYLFYTYMFWLIYCDRLSSHWLKQVGRVDIGLLWISRRVGGVTSSLLRVGRRIIGGVTSWLLRVGRSRVISNLLRVGRIACRFNGISRQRVGGSIDLTCRWQIAYCHLFCIP